MQGSVCCAAGFLEDLAQHNLVENFPLTNTLHLPTIMKQFKFGFGQDEEMEVKLVQKENDQNSDPGHQKSTTAPDASSDTVASSFKHDFQEEKIDSIPQNHIKQEEIIKNDFTIPIFDDEQEEEFEGKSDLIPGQYEGGKRIWEASKDLAKYALECIQNESSAENQWLHEGKLKILELGCGHAVPASVFLFYLPNQLERLDLQDYNEDVLQNITKNNVTLWNDSLKEVNQSIEDVDVTYWSGDWEQLIEKMPQGEFDLILAAETLYSSDSFEKQWKLMKHCLNPKTGRIWIASKRYYYGVGGGTFSFSEMIQEEANVKTVLEIQNGLSNVREILEIQMQ